MLPINLLCWQSPTSKPSDSPELVQLQVGSRPFSVHSAHSAFFLRIITKYRTRHPYTTPWIRRAGRRNTGMECRYSEPEIRESRKDLGVRLGMSLRRRFDRLADIRWQTVALMGLISSNLNYGKEVYMSVNCSDTRTLNQKNENMLCSLWLLPRCPSTFISTFSSAQPQHSTVRVAIK